MSTHDHAPKPSYRSRHRQRAHHEAHSPDHHEAVHPAAPPLQHPLVAPGEAELVATAAQLHGWIAYLRSVGSFAYDSEFIGEETYYPRLCLIQVATSARLTLLDPLAGLDLTAFWELLADEAVEKIVHAGEQDLEPVVRHLNQPPRNIFDTQVAAGFVGQRYPIGLANLVEALVGVKLGQASKFSQWDHRPLTPVQVRYAGNDVRYLPLVRQLIGEKLAGLGRGDWAREECAELSDVTRYRFDPGAQRLKVRGLEFLGPRQRAVLRALVAWRDRVARQEDVPPRALLQDMILASLARHPIAALPDLQHVRGLPRPVERAYGQEILATTQHALHAPLPQRDAKHHHPLSQAEGTQVENLWSALQQRCRDNAVDPALAVNKKDVTQLVSALAVGQPATDHRLLRGWRGRLLGDILQSALNNSAG